MSESVNCNITSSNNTGDLTWGHLESTEIYGRKTVSNSDDFLLINSRQDLLSNYKINHEASHCLIYAKNDDRVFGIYQCRATILMQLRFDGYLGFPGGLIDEGEDPVFSLNRELQEEMALDLSKYSVRLDNYIVSHYNEKSKLGLHFYALEVPMSDIMNIETQALNAKDYGIEVLGTVRVPLYTMGDGYRGFPAFLKNQFIGNSKTQLLHAIEYLNLMSKCEINRALQV